MSSLFRMLLVGRGSRCRVAASTYYKVNINLSERNLPNAKCRCKIFVAPFSSFRNYSSQANASIPDNKTKSSESFINSEGKELIYTGLLSKNIRNVKLFSLCTSILGISCQPIVYQHTMVTGKAADISLPIFALIGLFALATPLLLHIITKRYIISIEYDHKNDTYIAESYNILCRKKKVEFKPEDVTIPTVLGMFTTCAIKGKPVFIDAGGFENQEHYIRIMGYDKPLDLQGVVNNDDTDDAKKSN